MHIYCPKCNVGYEIDELLIKDEQKRLKCSNCGAVFAAGELKFEIEVDKDGDNADAEPFDLLHAAMLEDNIVADEESPKEESVILDSEDKALEEEPKETEKQVVDEEDEFEAKESFEEKNDVIENSDDDEEPVDLNSIFERLSEHTEHLMVQEKKLPFYEKIWLQIKNILGFHFKIKWGYVIAFMVVFVLISMFNNRYQIVRDIPFMNSVYKALGIKAKIPGEGLEFQNIGWEFFDDEDGARLEIKGFINNPTAKNIELPIIHVEILDKGTVLLQSHNREHEEKIVESKTKIPLNFVLENPAPTAKYVYLTFIDKD